MPIDAYPDAMSSFQDALTFRQGAEANELQLGMQKTLMKDQMVARAARMGAQSAEAWDQAFTELSQQYPEAQRYIGQWSPFAARELMQNIQAAPARAAAAQPGGIGGAAGPVASGIEAAAGPTFSGGAGGSNKSVQQPSGAGVDISTMTPAERTKAFRDVHRGLTELSKVQTLEDFESAVDRLAPEMPSVLELKGLFNDVTFAKGANALRDHYLGIYNQLAPLVMAQAAGSPVREAQPGYNVQYTEAGPVVATTPVGGGRPEFDFPTVRGDPRKEFMPAPSGGGGGAGGVSDLYGADGQLNITPQERQDYQYAADVLRRTGKMLPMGQGKSGTRARSIILALASRAAGPGGAAFDIGTAADIRASQMSLGQLQKLTDNVTAFEHLMLKNMETVERVMPEGIGGAWPWLNRWVQTGRTQFGDENVPAYATALITVLTEYAKIMSGATGAAGITDSAREEALQMLSPDFNKDQVREVFDVIRTDAKNRKVTLYDKLKEVRNRIRTTGTAGEGREPSVDDADDEYKPSWAR